MKIRRLPEIDLARICTLPPDRRRVALERFTVGYSKHTYNPTRALVPDIFNEQYPLFSAERTSWDKIENGLHAKCRSAKEFEYNRQVSRVLFDYTSDNKIKSYKKPVPHWAIGFGQSVKYWWDLYSLIGEQPHFVFVDPRLSSPLTSGGIRFTLSVMHQRLRVPDPDFADAKLAVFQFPKLAGQSRQLKIFSAEEFPLFSESELDEMIGETYALWLDVLRGREEDTRKRAQR